MKKISDKLYVKMKLFGLEKLKNIDVDKSIKIESTYINKSEIILEILEA